MLGRNYFPRYKEEHIISIVRHLYESKDKVLVNGICNRYLNNGYDFLRSIYREFNM